MSVLESSWSLPSYPEFLPHAVAEPSAPPSESAAERPLWTQIAEAFPSSAAVAIAMVPWVVETASRLPARDRIEHLAFVAHVAFSGCRDTSRIPAPLAERCYAAIRSTTAKLADECVRGGWEKWESACLSAAVCRIVGTLRRESREPRSRCAAAAEVDAENEIAAWLLSGIPGNLGRLQPA